MSEKKPFLVMSSRELGVWFYVEPGSDEEKLVIFRSGLLGEVAELLRHDARRQAVKGNKWAAAEMLITVDEIEAGEVEDD